MAVHEKMKLNQSLNLFLLLLLSTNLCTGGELVESTIYVNSTGVDDITCLNGGLSHPCKTLGHVLTNITKLQCTSCTILISYGHNVFSHTTSFTYYPIDINKLIYLEVNGWFNGLLFDGAGMSLSNYNGTTVVFKDAELVNCGDGAGDNLCVSTDSSSNSFLKEFSLVNVFINGDTAIMDIVARNVLCHKCIFNSGGLRLYAPRNSTELNFNIDDSVFSGATLTIALWQSLPTNVSVFGSISRCRFLNLQRANASIYIGIDLSRKLSSYVVDIVVNGTTVKLNQLQQGGFISVWLYSKYSSDAHIKLDLYNNSFVGNTFSSGLIASDAAVDNCSILYIIVNHSSFINNNGILMNLYQWTHVYIENTTIANNTADAYLISMQLHGSIICPIHRNIYMINNTISNNSISVFGIGNQKAVFFISALISSYSVNTVAIISGVTFFNNTGTPLALFSISLDVLGDVTFDSNKAVTGGGLYIDHGTTVDIANNATLIFTNNHAHYGGAIYIGESQHLCFLNAYSLNIIHVHGNIAVLGHSIFSSLKWCDYDGACINLTDVISLPTDIIVHNTSVFPGKPIVLDMFMADCYNNSVSCVADIFLINCASSSIKSCGEFGIYLLGLPTILIHTGQVHTGLAINTLSVSLPLSTQPVDVQLQLRCKTPTTSLPASTIATISLLQCPFGLSWDLISQQCECDSITETEFLCSSSAGIACVRKGYWYGNISSKPTVVKCLNLFCSFSKSVACPTDASNYVLLSQLQDDQCLNGHGGPLCTACAEGKTATYGGLQCIPSHQCKSWHPYMLLLLNILCPFVIGLLLILIIQLKLNAGSGYLYGPLFYLATVNLIPLVGWLNSVIKLFSATFLLKFQVLGYISWCFFSNVDLLYSIYFELIAPLVVSVVLLLIVYVARCIPRYRWLEYFQKSPVHAICVLILISFWSLASTSIQVIIPVYLSGINGARVNLKPDLAYLHEVHIPLWIVAVLILMMLLIVTVALMVSPFVGLHRIKPILDSLQSCYKDNMRWYGGVYFCIWTVLQILVLTSNYQIFQTVIIILLATHCLLQPYSHKWLNIMDGFLLACLAITSSLQDYISPDSNYEQEVIVCIFILLPLLLITVGIVSIILVRLRICSFMNSKIHVGRLRCRIHKASTKQTCTDTGTIHTCTSINVYHPRQAVADREPLIRYLQESADYGATSDTESKHVI